MVLPGGFGGYALISSSRHFFATAAAGGDGASWAPHGGPSGLAMLSVIIRPRRSSEDLDAPVVRRDARSAKLRAAQSTLPAVSPLARHCANVASWPVCMDRPRIASRKVMIGEVGLRYIPNCLPRAFRYVLASLSIVVRSTTMSPKLLPYAISPFCPASTDGLKRRSPCARPPRTLDFAAIEFEPNDTDRTSSLPVEYRRLDYRALSPHPSIVR